MPTQKMWVTESPSVGPGYYVVAPLALASDGFVYDLPT